MTEYQCLRCRTIYFKPQSCDWCFGEFAVRDEEEKAEEAADLQCSSDSHIPRT